MAAQETCRINCNSFGRSCFYPPQIHDRDITRPGLSNSRSLTHLETINWLLKIQEGKFTERDVPVP